MNVKAITLSLLIVQLIILAIVCWTWYNMFNSAFGGEMADGVGVIILIISAAYYFGLAVWSYILFKKGNENQNIVLQILLIVMLSAFPAIYLFF
jgi:hypothetical protein